MKIKSLSLNSKLFISYLIQLVIHFEQVQCKPSELDGQNFKPFYE